MRVWLVGLSLVAALAACGRYGPPVRSASPGLAPAQAEMPEDPNCEPTPETGPEREP